MHSEKWSSSFSVPRRIISFETLASECLEKERSILKEEGIKIRLQYSDDIGPMPSVAIGNDFYCLLEIPRVVVMLQIHSSATQGSRTATSAASRHQITRETVAVASLQKTWLLMSCQKTVRLGLLSIEFSIPFITKIVLILARSVYAQSFPAPDLGPLHSGVMSNRRGPPSRG